MREQFLIYFFGTVNVYLITSCFFFGCVGVFIMMLFDIMGRDKNSKYSSKRFDFKYFYRDNAPRFLLNFLLMLVCIRFSVDIINKPMDQFTALVFGVISDLIAIIIKKRKQKWADENVESITVTNTKTDTTTASATIQESSS